MKCSQLFANRMIEYGLKRGLLLKFATCFLKSTYQAFRSGSLYCIDYAAGYDSRPAQVKTMKDACLPFQRKIFEMTMGTLLKSRNRRTRTYLAWNQSRLAATIHCENVTTIHCENLSFTQGSHELRETRSK